MTDKPPVSNPQAQELTPAERKAMQARRERQDPSYIDYEAGWLDARAFAAAVPESAEDGRATAIRKLEALAAKKGRSMEQVIADAEAIEERFGKDFTVVVDERGQAHEREARSVPADETREDANGFG